ncbi:MAG: hypothetical protein E7113_06945 [Bacteroidales bacterium]|nr:hypothetical protein [Bacteroidales bacterium]
MMNPCDTPEVDVVDIYQNIAQILVTIVDPNQFWGVEGRATGKTTGIVAPRTLRVADGMPREQSIISHKSFVALMTNVIPSLLGAYRADVKLPDGTTRPQLTEGIDFVVGQKDLPRHFQKPRYPVLEPERSIAFANGHVLRAVAIDRADSIAGLSVVHAFLEEMKYSDPEKLRSRVIPAIRTSRIGAGSEAHKHHLHGGITGVSDMGRVSIGESNWFTEYEKRMDPQLIADIISLSLHINKARLNLQNGANLKRSESIIRKWSPLLSELRKQAVLYQRVSTFINRDVLGFDFFKTQLETLQMSEFLSAICSIGDRNRDNLFFDLWDEEKHTYEDSYRYEALDKLVLTDTMVVDASYLKYYDASDKILLGYDPGNFASMVVGQFKPKENTLRILKEFFVCAPDDIAELAANFNAYFGPAARNKRIDLYYDRAGNKKNQKRPHETDARELKAELEKYGWKVQLKNLGQRTIFYWEHYKLWKRLLAENENRIPHIRIDSNECSYLVSAMYCCKKVPGSSMPELDKTPEKKVPLNMQAGLTPQIPSAMTYLVWGLFEKYFPGLRNSSIAGANLADL